MWVFPFFWEGPLPEASSAESERRIWSDLIVFGRILIIGKSGLYKYMFP